MQTIRLLKDSTKDPGPGECFASLILLLLFVVLSWASIFLIVTDLVNSAAASSRTQASYDRIR